MGLQGTNTAQRRCGILGIVEGDVVDSAAQGQALAHGGFVSDLCHGVGATGKSAFEGDDAICRGVLLVDHLQRIFVGHGSAEREPDVSKIAPCVLEEQLAQPEILGSGGEMPLKDVIRGSRNNGVFQEIGVTVAEAIDSDSTDEVEFGGTVRQAHPGATTGTARQDRQIEVPAAQTC